MVAASMQPLRFDVFVVETEQDLPTANSHMAWCFANVTADVESREVPVTHSHSYYSGFFAGIGVL